MERKEDKDFMLSNFVVDNLGRIVISDYVLFEKINGSFANGHFLSDMACPYNQCGCFDTNCPEIGCHQTSCHNNGCIDVKCH